MISEEVLDQDVNGTTQNVRKGEQNYEPDEPASTNWCVWKLIQIYPIVLNPHQRQSLSQALELGDWPLDDWIWLKT